MPQSVRAHACSAALVMLAACTEDAPVAPGDQGAPSSDPALAVGFYGLSGAPTGPVGRPCRRPEYRQFDFWVGQWEVKIFGTGAPSGTNIITSELDGCAVFEDYANAGYVGRSLNTYDAADDQWHQHWIANDALPLLLDGAAQGSAMVMQGFRPTPAGPILDRITWTPLSSERVRQFWDSSSDSGATFPTIVFDGEYFRRESVTQDPEIPTPFCSDPAFPAYRLFDFTIGEWEVSAQGEHRTVPTLRSTITRDLSDCLTEERLTGRAGYEARVFNTMRRRTGEWLRTFIDNRGVRVLLRGIPTEGALVLTGTMPIAGGEVADVRATWEPVDASRFRQRYETSTDGGVTWKLLLLAQYTRQ
jgi:hypothetical protein